jgi:anti-sigma regulatory factor (Ser/Thr protein kinase)
MRPTGHSTRFRIAQSAASVPGARAVVRRLLKDAGIGNDVRATAELLATELVSNAVEHGGGASYLDAVVGAHSVRIEVTDPNPVMPTPSPSLGELNERGRGLLLISALASRWGTERRPPGKTVWCEIARA